MKRGKAGGAAVPRGVVRPPADLPAAGRSNIATCRVIEGGRHNTVQEMASGELVRALREAAE